LELLFVSIESIRRSKRPGVYHWDAECCTPSRGCVSAPSEALKGHSPILPQLKKQPVLAPTTQLPFNYISNRCNKKYELVRDSVLDYYFTASHRPRAKMGVTGLMAFKTLELGV
jgi:hypothetical protein